MVQGRGLRTSWRGLQVLLIVGILAASLASAEPAAARRVNLRVMTRNVYLGADLSGGLNATGLQSLVNVAGGILHQVDQNKFQVRARGLAAEILSQQPDLVGLQEVALWRSEPCTLSPIPPKATHIRYDYLKLLLAQLNRGRRRYRAVVVQPEFDFEVYANLDGNASTHAPGCPFGSEVNGRLTMRDVILARVGRVKTSRPRGGHYRTLMRPTPAGVPLPITRGWTSVDATVPGAPKFRFVNTHLESFDDTLSNPTSAGTNVGRGQVREAQARELFAHGGPATGALPVILVGDLNSDRRTAVQPGDGLADSALLSAGFAERSTNRNGCCLKTNILTTSGGGRRRDFNHRVDHIMTNAPRKIRFVNSTLTGLSPVHGFWDSDHAGLVSTLSLP